MDALVLSVVASESTYGYKITQDVRSVMEVSESTLYPVLRRLQKSECLRPTTVNSQAVTAAITASRKRGASSWKRMPP